ncbi:hypothetical protein BCR44DRAFT_1012955 [Catenaria anguillulae PL171]|uniref:E3 UFM1-protein ligase 1-like N-terminal domain-containing protein n=1 Tax=Catenaria anguillulae PL171 TaxID=765915 RepID=A0A1Y2I6U2_9FUNG|nr:hypothetical protein BCR44DRAFT_1012955 [Catenaria anguillulae PL171]
MAFSPSSSSSSSSTAKAKSKAKASSETPSPPSSTAATNIPAHVLDHLLDLLVGCGDLPPSFHTVATADPSLVTEAYLVAKLQSTLDARGHVPFHQLAALLQVNQQTADHILDLVLSGAQGSVFLVDSFVVTQAGYKGLEHQLVDVITERGGVANADTLAGATGTSTGLVYLMLDKPHLLSAVHRDSIDTSVYYSSLFANKLAVQLADTLSNATEPTNIKPILTSTGCPAGLWQSTLHALMPTLAGRVSNLLYTPTAY